MCLFLYSKQILTTTTKHQGAEAGNILSRKYLGDCPCPPDDTQALAAKFRIQVLLFVHKRIIILGDLLQPRRGKNISPHQTRLCEACGQHAKGSCTASSKGEGQALPRPTGVCRATKAAPRTGRQEDARQVAHASGCKAKDRASLSLAGQARQRPRREDRLLLLASHITRRTICRTTWTKRTPRCWPGHTAGGAHLHRPPSKPQTARDSRSGPTCAHGAI